MPRHRVACNEIFDENVYKSVGGKKLKMFTQTEVSRLREKIMMEKKING